MTNSPHTPPDQNDRPGWYYRGHVAGRRKPWPGPRYRLHRTATRDLMILLNEVIALVKVNAPLVQGLEAAARTRAGRKRLPTRAPAPPASSRVRMRRLLIIGVIVVILAAILAQSIMFSVVYRLQPGDFEILLSMVPIIIIGALLMREFGFPGAKREAILLAVRDRLAQGEPLSEALESLRNIVPPSVVDVTAAGEASGQLYNALSAVRDRLLAKTQAREQLVLTLTYGAFVLLIIANLLGFLMLKVVPVFAEIHEEFSHDLPERTVVLINLTDWVVNNGFSYFMLGAPAALLAALLAYLVYRKTRRRTVSLFELPLFYLPFIRSALLQASLASVCEVLAMLLKAGVPLPRALEQAGHLHVHPHLRKTLRALNRQVEMGETMADATRTQRRRLPASFPAIVALGEQSGMLPDAMAYLADLYADNTQMRQQVLGQLLLPAVVLTLGAIVLFVELAMYEAIWGITDALFYSL